MPEWNRWVFEPGVIVALSAAAVVYALAATRFRARLVAAGGASPAWLPPGALSRERPGALAPAQVVAFYAGLLVAAVALLSPLSVLADGYLLIAHMGQHYLLTLVTPPLVLLGTPGWMLRPLFRWAALRRYAALLLSPIPAFVIFNATLAVWHLPALYQLSVVSLPVHVLQHVTFAGTAVLAWWPVYGPLPEIPRLPHGAQVLYLFFQSVPALIIGALITLSQGPVYPVYWEAPRVFPIPPLDDQQIGGLVMWIGGAMAYLLALSVSWFQWLERRGPRESPPYGQVNPDRARLARQAARPNPIRPA